MNASRLPMPMLTPMVSVMLTALDQAGQKLGCEAAGARRFSCFASSRPRQTGHQHRSYAGARRGEGVVRERLDSPVHAPDKRTEIAGLAVFTELYARRHHSHESPTRREKPRRVGDVVNVSSVCERR